jgi:hypothetical protein
VEGAGDSECASCDPEPASDSTVTEEVGDLGGIGMDGDACFCLEALLLAGVDGREVDEVEEAFAEGPFASLAFQDIGNASEVSGVAGVTGRGRAPFSPLRVDRTVEAATDDGAVL